MVKNTPKSDENTPKNDKNSTKNIEKTPQNIKKLTENTAKNSKNSGNNTEKNNKKNTGKNGKKVLIGLSWVYANGRLHIGHVGSSLPADAIARFHRLIGNDVSFVTGSDCYGTPILVEALKEGIAPAELAEKYHRLLDSDFAKLGFTFDNYSKTMSEYHNKFAMDFHANMYKGKYVYEKSANQLYCEKCAKYLPDRYVEGICPYCKKPAKGDSCDSCGKILEPEDLLEPKCKLCGSRPVPRNTSQLYLKLSAMQDELQKYYDSKKEDWTINAQGLCGRYLNEGLLDRAITRNIEWGVPVPVDCSDKNCGSVSAGSKAKGCEDVPANSVKNDLKEQSSKQKDGCLIKKICENKDEWAEKRIYIWAENVLGYLSAAKEYCEKTGQDWKEYLLDAEDEGTSTAAADSGADENFGTGKNKCAENSADSDKLHYYVHAKDNIPFHTIILPGLMIANGGFKQSGAGSGERLWHKPDVIVASEYITLEGKKMSKSAGTLLTACEMYGAFDADLIRYYFLRNTNDRKDVNFSFSDFVNTVNGELINNFGNLVNRTLSFVNSKLGGQVKVFPEAEISAEVTGAIRGTYKSVSELMTAGRTGKALQTAFDLVNFGNKYFDTCKPWESIKTDRDKCSGNIFEVITVISNVVKICEPFVPFGCVKVQKWLLVPRDKFELFIHEKDFNISQSGVEILYKRLDLKEVAEKFKKYI